MLYRSVRIDVGICRMFPSVSVIDVRTMKGGSESGVSNGDPCGVPNSVPSG